ncbi:MAG: glycosyltransferase family 4 protein [Sedimentisphaerales bacterium]|nr:glycosyltransferase family 4 protein [Sedimentisphaerales bacterium]
MTIRVLHLIGSLKLGGAQVSVKYLTENADCGKIETFVYPLRSRDIDIPIRGNVIKLPYRNYDPRKFLTILRLCKKYHIDIIHAHLEKPILGGLLAGYFSKVRVIVHEHGPVFRKGIKASIYRFFLRLLHHRASLIIANSHATADCLINRIKVNPNRIRIIYNAVDLETFTPDRQARQRIRNQLAIEPRDIVIGFIGRLHTVKGPDLLIEAMSVLLKKSPRYLLIMLGEGPQRCFLEALAERLGITDCVRFLGFRENVSEVMNAFDIGVIPSRQEPFGIVALEYMSMKIPLVCSAADGLAELVSNEETALVPADNIPKEIAYSIERLADNREMCDQLTEAALCYCENFSVPKHIKAIENTYVELLNDNERI